MKPTEHNDMYDTTVSQSDNGKYPFTDTIRTLDLTIVGTLVVFDGHSNKHFFDVATLCK